MAEQKPEKETQEVAPWRPFSDIARWERDMEELFDNLAGSRFWPFRRRPWPPLRAMEISAPAVDVYEEKDDIVAKAELPGVGKDDIEVNVADNFLTIKGQKKKEEELKEENYYRCERSYGSFTRVVQLPSEVQTEKARASFKDGVLEVRIPKTDEAKKKVKKVKVQ